MDDITFRQLLTHLHLSWKGYRKVRKGVKKRISRHMKELECRTLHEYLGYLNSDLRAKAQCDLLMTVPISRFFRDRQLWKCLETFLLDELLKHARDETINVWSAGCACGEEPNSFRIIWDKISKGFSSEPRLRILATDTNAKNLNRAKAGVYPKSSLKEVPEVIKNQYFLSKKGGNQFELKDILRSEVIWFQHHLLSPPPESMFHIIFLRNSLLTYYKDTLKLPAFQSIVHQLKPSGMLILGSHERLPSVNHSLIRDERCKFVYLKK